MEMTMAYSDRKHLYTIVDSIIRSIPDELEFDDVFRVRAIAMAEQILLATATARDRDQAVTQIMEKVRAVVHEVEMRELYEAEMRELTEAEIEDHFEAEKLRREGGKRLS
jgi:hypothetical protein